MQVSTIDDIVTRALAEDIGDGDVTTAATVDPAVRARAVITQKAAGVIYGLDAAEFAFRALDPDVALTRRIEEGVWRDGGEVLVIEGSAAALLTAERTALNFLQRLSGVATLAARCAEAVKGTGTRILDTRKTTPGLRMLEKAAVAAGGATNHRVGLFDAILIKENHAALAGGVGAAVRRAHAAAPDLPLEVECENLDELDEALDAGATMILLDNMSIAQMTEAVQRTRVRSTPATLEASGGLTLQTLRDVAQTGVDFISVGAITHSAPALDLSLLLTPVS